MDAFILVREMTSAASKVKTLGGCGFAEVLKSSLISFSVCLLLSSPSPREGGEFRPPSRVTEKRSWVKIALVKQMSKSKKSKSNSLKQFINLKTCFHLVIVLSKMWSFSLGSASSRRRRRPCRCQSETSGASKKFRPELKIKTKLSFFHWASSINSLVTTCFGFCVLFLHVNIFFTSKFVEMNWFYAFWFQPVCYQKSVFSRGIFQIAAGKMISKHPQNFTVMCAKLARASKIFGMQGRHSCSCTY